MTEEQDQLDRIEEKLDELLEERQKESVVKVIRKEPEPSGLIGWLKK